MNSLSKRPAFRDEVGEAAHEQRIDNYLAKRLKGVPKSLIYRMLRTGEVRVNSRRVEPGYRLQAGDRVRIPPLRQGQRPSPRLPQGGPDLWQRTLYEDEWLVAIDKPAGLAVHGGSGVSLGAIEALRLQRPGLRFLELAHRLDKETSGVLLLAKKRDALAALHEQLRSGEVEKVYLALAKGYWRWPERRVLLPLNKYVTATGERRVSVKPGGRASETRFILERAWEEASLLRAQLMTGRTHQIRVHLAHLGHPIAGDDKYGDFAWNRKLACLGLKRMFLHAARVGFHHPASKAYLIIDAPLPEELRNFLTLLAQESSGLPHD
ncbi:RluA family pseudouridine synthase [Pelomicrobium sp.]|mgnify:CR=1 FL=1|uniref:RluA family pseudouridine synthase n=1 Tax=Pelomicrobium sp. TaxID=2815319 RepID=UPI002FDD150D